MAYGGGLGHAGEAAKGVSAERCSKAASRGDFGGGGERGEARGRERPPAARGGGGAEAREEGATLSAASPPGKWTQGSCGFKSFL